MAKLLANKLKTCLPELISSTQSDFIKGRQILDGVFIANELVDSKKKSQKLGILFKEDFEKAYDRVNWEFIRWMMRMMGFSPKWIDWVWRCISYVAFSTLINGEVK